jgi:hypothetical protein
MPTLGAELKRTAIAAVLEHGVGSSADTIAEATVKTWQRVGARLAPVIGAHGVDVLFYRALQQTAAIFPWLEIRGKHENSDALLPGLKLSLASQEAVVSAAAGLALRLAFIELLATLIGLPLTQRLLGPVWVIAVNGD